MCTKATYYRARVCVGSRLTEHVCTTMWEVFRTCEVHFPKKIVTTIRVTLDLLKLLCRNEVIVKVHKSHFTSNKLYIF